MGYEGSSRDERFKGGPLDEVDLSIRPGTFGEFTGQDAVLSNLKVFTAAAKMRSEPLDHVLLHGPPGLGKTTLAHIIAAELGVDIKVTSGPVIDKPGDLAGMLTNLQTGDLLFIDEIHRLSPIVEEFLYSAMEDFSIDIVIDKGPAARTIQIDLNRFTLVGATTRSGLLTNPLRARFGINCLLEYYDLPRLFQIVKRSAGILSIEIEEEAAREIARRSRGTPRVANALLRRVRDFAMVQGDGTITYDITQVALNALSIDGMGLDLMDRKILQVMVEKFSGGPVGLNTLAAAVSEDIGTVQDVYEPYLIMQGLLQRTPRGRVATPLAFRHLGYESSGTIFII